MKKNTKVTKVKDGDTFKVKDKIKNSNWIRINKIDTPEKGQRNYRKAKQYLENKILDETVTIEPVAKDKYGRVVANVYLDGKGVGKKIKKKGLG